MAYSKANMRAVDKYVKTNYDSFLVRVPKGCKGLIQAAADKERESINLYTSKALLARMGLPEWPEKETQGTEQE